MKGIFCLHLITHSGSLRIIFKANVSCKCCGYVIRCLVIVEILSEFATKMIHNSIKFLVTSIAKQTSTYRSFHRTAANQNFISNWIRSVKFYMNERKSPPWNHCIQIGNQFPSFACQHDHSFSPPLIFRWSSTPRGRNWNAHRRYAGSG